jgi:demethylmenaquinone methyltransferase/2-methoxy-6-polyprenyl-1,4-benzoquinol methylase
MVRVAKAKARILILEFGKPDNPVLRAAYLTYLRLIVPGFGAIFCGDPRAYAYILESLQQYPRQDVVAEQLKALECSSVQIFDILGGTMCIHRATR